MSTQQQFIISTMFMVLHMLSPALAFSRYPTENNVYPSNVDRVTAMVSDGYSPTFRHPSDPRDFHDAIQTTHINNQDLYKMTASYLRADIGRLRKRQIQEKNILRKISEIQMAESFQQDINNDFEESLSMPDGFVKRGQNSSFTFKSEKESLETQIIDVLKKYLLKIAKLIDLRKSLDRSFSRKPSAFKKTSTKFRKYHTFDLIGSGLVGK